MTMLRLLLILVLCGSPLWAGTRLKELVAVQGVRDNQLIGYGIVVGLNGTGDKRQTVFSYQSLANLLERLGVSVSPQALQVRNAAAVLVTATLPPFAQPGMKIDITASAIGDAQNLQGGELILTPLKGGDGEVYAVAQGAVVTGGFVAGRGGGTSQTTNHPTSGRIPNGAIVEKAAPSVEPSSFVNLQLRRADFTNASRISKAINEHYDAEPGIAKAESASLVHVEIPKEYKARQVDFLAELEAIQVNADAPNKIVISEKTGTITMGKEVRIAPVAILQGKLSVEILRSPIISQPEPLSKGQTAAAVETQVNAKEEKAKNIQLGPGATVDELVKGLLATGSTPRDVIAVLQNLKASGALDAELEVI